MITEAGSETFLPSRWLWIRRCKKRLPRPMADCTVYLPILYPMGGGSC